MKKLSTTIIVCVLIMLLNLVLGTIWVRTVKPLWSDFVMAQFAKTDYSQSSIAKWSNIYGVGASIINYIPTGLAFIAEVRLWRRYKKLQNTIFFAGSDDYNDEDDAHYELTEDD